MLDGTQHSHVHKHTHNMTWINLGPASIVRGSQSIALLRRTRRRKAKIICTHVALARRPTSPMSRCTFSFLWRVRGTPACAIKAQRWMASTWCHRHQQHQPSSSHHSSNNSRAVATVAQTLFARCCCRGESIANRTRARRLRWSKSEKPSCRKMLCLCFFGRVSVQCVQSVCVCRAKYSLAISLQYTVCGQYNRYIRNTID